jgi:bifunctional DNase/RNase
MPSNPVIRWWVFATVLMLLVSTPPTLQAEENHKLQELEVLGVSADPGGQIRLLLRGKNDKRGITMYIGQFEAIGIALPLEGVEPPRPYTHDLILNLLKSLKASLTKVVINDLKGSTYYATLYLQVNGREIRMDSRPSDAVALALRARAPILAAEPAFQTPSVEEKP